mmetsp:Transcript_21370/g.42885  ORF Transcript_21370/g.42885 Transcript_21370/m.42885 type:complete len:807 (+) Transcript_21370:83-2503(+)
MSSLAPPLPPQAPTSTRNRSFEEGENNDNHRTSSSRTSKKHGHKSNRARSSSDGVRTMQQRQQQQQQQQQWAYGGYPPAGYQQQGPPPPSQFTFPPTDESNNRKKTSRRTNSYDMNSNPAHPLTGSNGSPTGGYGSTSPRGRFMPHGLSQSMRSINSGGVPRPPNPAPQPREFSAMNEITSVMGRSPRLGNGFPPAMGAPPAGPNGRSHFHRRTMSDSMAGRGGGNAVPMPLPPLPQGIHPSHPYAIQHAQARARADSYGSQHSGPRSNGPSPRGVYMGEEPFGSESDPFLQSTMGGKKGSRPKTHMRQNSVNLYMKPIKGERQPRSCKDVLYAILFVLQMAAVLVVGLKFGPEALVETEAELGPSEGMADDDVALESVIDATVGAPQDAKVVLAYWNIMKMACTCGAFAMIISAMALAFMMAMSRRLVYVALVLSIGVSFAWGTIGIGISPNSFVPVSGIIALMLTVGYMFVVWDRIPFASANLTTALTGVRDNLGLVGVAFFFQFLALVASIYYSFTFVGLHDAMYNGQLMISDNMKVAVDVLLFVSYYWTYQVLRHIVMVTVAGTIGSWWFKQDSALNETFFRATVCNFGSICYGSLYVGVVQFLRQITEGMRPHHDESSLMCLYEFTLYFQERLVTLVDNLADSFTPWAFTYIGLYHYSLGDSGHKVNELFDRRGWSRIVTDDLIPSVLTMVSLVIGGLSGSFAVILQALDGQGLTSFGHPVATSFTIGFLVGIVLSTVLFSIIESSVQGVIVCFAGSPVEFQRNHPELSHEMRHAWKEVWPGSLDIGTPTIGVGVGVPMGM